MPLEFELPDETASKILSAIAEIASELVADPKKTVARMRQLVDATDQAKAAIAEANAARKALKDEKAEHDRTIAAERAAHMEALARDKNIFERAKADFEKQRVGLLNHAEQVRTAAQIDADAAKALKSKYESALSKIRDAAAA
jgi:hypothetical protein